MSEESTARSGRGVYGISVAAELSGLGQQTLRLYERRGLLAPARTAGGTRRYSDDDLARLQRITELLADGVNVAGVGQILDLEARNTQLESDNTQLKSDNARLAAARRPDERRRTDRKQGRETIMTNADDRPERDDIPEADLAEQQTPVDGDTDEDGLDPSRVTVDSTMEADPADLIDQAISVPYPDDDDIE